SVKPIHVVEFTLQRITENVIGLGDPFEVLFRMAITRVDIRMEPAGQLPKSSFDFILRSGPINLENNIKIFSAGPGLLLLLSLFLIGIDVFRVDDIVWTSASSVRGSVA